MKHGIRLTFQSQEPDPTSGRGVSLRCPSRPSRLKSNTPPYIRQLDTVFWTTLYKIVCFPRCDSKLSSSVDYLPSIECRQFFAVNCLLSIICRRLFAVDCLPSILCHCLDANCLFCAVYSFFNQFTKINKNTIGKVKGRDPRRRQKYRQD